MQFRAEMSQWKEVFYDTLIYQTARCLDERNEKKTEVKMYIYIHRSYENLPCMNWAKTVNFDHFENKCKNKALFKITQ